MFGIKTRILKLRHMYQVDHCPQRVIDRKWLMEYGYKIDWNHPKDLNEKIQWLICYGDTSKWPDLTDKLKVRDYVSQKGYADILTKLYGVWDDARKIDFEALPEKFVLKCNHDSGSCHIIDKSKKYNKEEIVNELNKSLKKKYGYIHCEPHYNKITPCIIAEEFLQMPVGHFSSSLVDYKIWCFNGKPYSIHTIYNRTKNSISVDFYDLDWNAHPEQQIITNHYRDGKGLVPKPESLDKMLEIASSLSEGFPEVRVDLYNVGGKIYFGEMTFTSNYGQMDNITMDSLKELGDLVKLPL